MSHLVECNLCHARYWVLDEPVGTKANGRHNGPRDDVASAVPCGGELIKVEVKEPAK